MNRRRRPPAKRPRSAAAPARPPAEIRLPAAVFKAKCLSLMNRVKEAGVEYVVTKHREPVARLVPYRALPKRSSFGCMRGTVLAYDRPFDAIDGKYDLDAE